MSNYEYSTTAIVLAAILLTSLLSYMICRFKTMTTELRKVKEDLKSTENQTHALLERRLETLKADKERAEEASRAKSLFLATMSHELRNPLSSIIGVADLIQHCRHKKDHDRYLRIFQTASESLLELVNDVLDLSKIEAEQIQLEELPTNLHKMIECLYEISHPLARSKEIDLTYHLSKEVPIWIKADSKRLRQAILNLLSNAIKYTEHGRVHFEIALDQSQELETPHPEMQWIQFRISDTGMGIPNELLPHIFDYYTRAPGAYMKRLEGCGLGLAISKRLVTLMGGKISVDSKMGAGSTFTLLIPFELARSTCQVQENGSNHLQRLNPVADTHPVSGAKKRILVADDSDDNRLIIRRFLSENHWEVHCATNGQEALNLVVKQPFDLVLMDMQMPQMDGHEATRKIREFEHQNLREPTPIVALTGNVMTDDITQCLNSGCNDHIGKPVRQRQLLEVVHRYIV